MRSGGTIARDFLADRPTNPPNVWPSMPPTAAPASATSGTYGLPSPTKPGANRAPTIAPVKSPTSDRTPVTSPRRKPLTTARTMTTTAIQSAAFTLQVCRRRQRSHRENHGAATITRRSGA